MTGRQWALFHVLEAINDDPELFGNDTDQVWTELFALLVEELGMTPLVNR